MSNNLWVLQICLSKITLSLSGIILVFIDGIHDSFIVVSQLLLSFTWLSCTLVLLHSTLLSVFDLFVVITHLVVLSAHRSSQWTLVSWLHSFELSWLSKQRSLLHLLLFLIRVNQVSVLGGRVSVHSESFQDC